MLRAWGGDRFEVVSAGTEATGVRPEAIAGDGRDRDRHRRARRSKTLEPFVGQPFSWLVTVCDEAKEACPTLPGVRRQAHWNVEDPSSVEGDEAGRLEAFRAARDDLRERIGRFILEGRRSRSGDPRLGRLGTLAGAEPHRPRLPPLPPGGRGADRVRPLWLALARTTRCPAAAVLLERPAGTMTSRSCCCAARSSPASARGTSRPATSTRESRSSKRRVPRDERGGGHRRSSSSSWLASITRRRRNAVTAVFRARRRRTPRRPVADRLRVERPRLGGALGHPRRGCRASRSRLDGRCRRRLGRRGASADRRAPDDAPGSAALHSRPIPSRQETDARLARHAWPSPAPPDRSATRCSSGSPPGRPSGPRPRSTSGSSSSRRRSRRSTGVRMELDDCAFPLLESIVCTADTDEAFRGAELGAPRRRRSAQGGHGTQGPARHQRRDLHRPGRGDRARTPPDDCPGAGRRQPVQHERAHRLHGRRAPRHAEGPVVRHDHARREPWPLAAGQEGGRAGPRGARPGDLGQPLVDPVPRCVARDDRRPAGARGHRRRRMARGRVHHAASSSGARRSSRPVARARRPALRTP